MTKRALAILVAMTVGFLTVPAVWAAGQQEEAVKLSQQCQEALRADTANQEAASLCREGDKALMEGDTEKAITKLTQGLEKLGVEVETEKR